jgi:NADPH-dependent 2,4-dienoyl-CoA reductase/sulfur reductase-like enzyme
VEKVKAVFQDVEKVVVIGGGVLGLEAAWEIRRRPGKNVTVLEAAPQIMGRQIDQNAASVL